MTNKSILVVAVSSKIDAMARMHFTDLFICPVTKYISRVELTFIELINFVWHQFLFSHNPFDTIHAACRYITHIYLLFWKFRRVWPISIFWKSHEYICNRLLRKIDGLREILLCDYENLFIEARCQSITRTGAWFPLIQVLSLPLRQIWNKLGSFIHHFRREISRSGRISSKHFSSC